MPSSPPPGFGREITDRPVLARFDTYADAQAAVDALSDAGFPVQNVAIVGVDLRLVESVLGRWSVGRSALSGMSTGAWFGIMIGLFVSVIGIEEGQRDLGSLMVLGLLYGAAFGIVYGLVSYGLTRGRRDFVSRQALQATRYDLLCDAAVIGRARQMLGVAAAWPPPPPPTPPPPPPLPPQTPPEAP